jgi:ribosomal protein S18 acetylase RimI-like enzyme
MTHRPAVAADEPFVRDLICELVTADLGAANWPEAVRAPLLEIQYRGRISGIRDQFPDAAEEILLADGEPVGWAVIHRGPEELRLVEIAVRSVSRGKGIGEARLQELLAEADAAGKPVRLRVAAGNRAIRLYLRLGFRQTGSDEVRVWMERPAGGIGPPAGAV